jgi:hypothetical protein
MKKLGITSMVLLMTVMSTSVFAADDLSDLDAMLNDTTSTDTTSTDTT